MKNKKVYLLSYDHGGYILWGPHFMNSLKTARNWLDKYPKFKLGLDNEAYAYDRYSEEDPEIIKEINKMLGEYRGRFDIGSSTYGQPLSCFISEESNVRQITYALRSCLEHFNVRPYVFVISEHALHSQIPQLVSKAGYHSAIMRTHFQMYGFNPTYNTGFGSWIGDDGTAVDCVPTYNGQGSHFGAATLDNYILTRWPEWKDSIDDFAEKFCDIEPLLATRYDDVVLRREEFTSLVEKRDDLDWVILPDLKDVYKSYADRKDVYRPSSDEFKTRMPWGYCGNRLFNGARKAETDIILTERLAVFAKLLGFDTDESKLRCAWSNLLVAQHHDIQICGLIRLFDEMMEKFRSAERDVREQAVRNISGLFESPDGRNVLVINTSDKPVCQLVCQNVRNAGLKRGDNLIAYSQSDCCPCEYDVYEASGENLRYINVRFMASMPPFTVRSYSLRITEGSYWKSAPEITDCVCGEFFDILLGRGGIRRITEKSTGIVLADNGEDGCLFAGIIDGKDERSSGEWCVRYGTIVTTATYAGFTGSIPFCFSLELRKGDPVIYCKCSFDFSGEVIGSSAEFEKFIDNTNGFVHEDKLRFLISVPLDRSFRRFRDRPFLVDETNEKYIECNYWSGVTDGKLSAAVINKGAMCLTVEDSGISVPLAYSNTYVWGERYLYGKYEHEFSLLLSSGKMDTQMIHTRAVQYNYPLVSCQIDEKHDGRSECTLLPVKSDSNVLMSSLSVESGQITARFYEFCGQKGAVDFDTAKSHAVNLLNEPVSDIENGSLEIGPHEISTVVIDQQ